MLNLLYQNVDSKIILIAPQPFFFPQNIVIFSHYFNKRYKKPQAPALFIILPIMLLIAVLRTSIKISDCILLFSVQPFQFVSQQNDKSSAYGETIGKHKRARKLHQLLMQLFWINNLLEDRS